MQWTRKQLLLAYRALATPTLGVAQRPQDHRRVGLSDAALTAIQRGYETRVKDLFGTQKESPLHRAAIRGPINEGRPDYVRGYSGSLAQFAAANMWLAQNIDQADAALAEDADYFLDHRESIYDRDNFHWHSDLLLRLIEFFGEKGRIQPGLMKSETEDKILEAEWLYCKRRQQDQTRYNTLSVADHNVSGTWYIYESENHHAQSFCTQWHFAKLAKDRPRFNDRRYDDGRKAMEHYEDWNDCLKAYFTERAKKGLLIEMMCVEYNKEQVRGIFTIYDCCDDADLKRKAGDYLTLYLTYWAQEQPNGISGGGKSRMYTDISPHASEYGYLFFGTGERPRFQSALVPAMTTSIPP